MAERRDSLTLGRVAPAQGVVRRMDCELAFQPFLGVTKVQVLDADPDAWLAWRMGSELVAPRMVRCKSICETSLNTRG